MNVTNNKIDIYCDKKSHSINLLIIIMNTVNPNIVQLYKYRQSYLDNLDQVLI
jgi:hypothetical protein